ncbi:hypothetical protein ONS95_010338 [Cadophora gregata]|uniref:uncharacterized protein n=1 Tax=Cadophora gregata TaxID=51156 RepID=UPI0026DC40DA|nr:uncharacterized protein ONS95_010338 [Cadophora gregata]KAK0122074.1 hypothetical protein ONS95_010338 [Cadophora gregata]
MSDEPSIAAPAALLTNHNTNYLASPLDFSLDSPIAIPLAKNHIYSQSITASLNSAREHPLPPFPQRLTDDTLTSCAIGRRSSSYRTLSVIDRFLRPQKSDIYPFPAEPSDGIDSVNKVDTTKSVCT